MPVTPTDSRDSRHTATAKAKALQGYKGTPAPPSNMRPVLTFEKDAVIDVISQSNPEWWKVGFCLSVLKKKNKSKIALCKSQSEIYTVASKEAPFVNPKVKFILSPQERRLVLIPK